MRRLLAVAVTACTLAGCVTIGGGDAPPTSFPPQAPAGGASPAIPGLPVRVAASSRLPNALELVAPAAGGRAMYVLGPDEDGTTCGSERRRSLQVWPLDGDPVRALDPELDVTRALPRADGTVLLLDVCDGEVDAAYIGTPAADGTFDDVVSVPLPGVPTGDDVAADAAGDETADGEVADVADTPTTIAVVPGPGALLTVAQVGATGPRVVRVAADGTPEGAPVAVARELYDPVVDGERLWTVVAGSDPAVVDVLGGLRHVGFDQVAPHPDGVVVAGARGIAVVGASGTPVPVVDDGRDWTAPTALEDGRVVAVLDPVADARLVLLDAEGVVGVVEEGVAPVRPWSLGGARVVYELVDPTTFATTVVVRDL